MPIPPYQFLIAASVLIITTLLILLKCLTERRKFKTIVLTGISGSGKTTLFYQLEDGSFYEGVLASMEPYEDIFILHSERSKKGKVKPVHVVDVPGYSHFRHNLDEFLPQAAAIIFVVDALEFRPYMRQNAEYLYDILTKAIVVKRKVPVLICCNKADDVAAHTMVFIRKQLEKEIDRLRTSRNDFTLGVPGEAFSLSHCSNKVKFAESDCVNGDISQVEEFIRAHVKP